MSETYQGGNASFAPPEYIQQLRAWCDQHRALLIFDEVQAGFGRTGTYWGFEHYGVVPDLILLRQRHLQRTADFGLDRPERRDGPVSAGGDDLDAHRQSRLRGRLLANLKAIRGGAAGRECPDNGRNPARPSCGSIAGRFPQAIGAVHGRGLVAALHIVKPGGIEPDAATAATIVRLCVEKGLMLFAPVGYGGASVKIAPPLIITRKRSPME